MKVIYCAGPYRGKNEVDVRRNVERAKWWAEAVWRLGAAAICPHTNTYDMDLAVEPEEFVVRDLELVRRCDAVLMLPGWQHSSGAVKERAEASLCGLKVFYWDDLRALQLWLIGKGPGDGQS